MDSPLLSSGQVPLVPHNHKELDRNFAKGGRSFYFFDFDDNVIHLGTQIVLFHRHRAEEREVSTQAYATISNLVGKAGSEWEDFEFRLDPGPESSFRNFREQDRARLAGKNQPLVHDMLSALQNPFLEWRGPSWEFFVHAVNNNRPLSIITARGHHPHTIRRAINILVESRDLSASPNYLSIYPVSHDDTRKKLGDLDYKWSIAELKKEAIKAAVRDAFECFGENPFHRFGMSDDDPLNVALIREAMHDLKKIYPENAFFVFDTHGRKISREEILIDGEKSQNMTLEQMSLF